MFYQPIISKSYLTEINLVNAPTQGAKVPFLDIPMLRGVRTIGLSCFTETQLTKSPNNKTIVSTVAGLVLTLAVVSTEEIFQFPCYDLVSGNNSGLIRLLNNKIIDLPKSFITILDTSSLSQDESVCFNFIYTGNPVNV